MNLPPASPAIAETAQSSYQVHAHLRDRWLMIARIRWVGITLLTLGLVLGSIPS